MNKNSRSILLGMLLGDGCLKPKPHVLKNGDKTYYYEYVISHSTKQEEYCQYKLELFHSIMGGKKPKMSYGKPRIKGIEYNSCRFSRCHKLFKILHKYLYSNDNKKYFTKRVLDYLTPQAIAIWYMDDGGVSKAKRSDGSVSSVQMRLYTYCTEEEIETIINYFSGKWGLKAKKKYYKINNSWNIEFNTTEGRKFEKLIEDFVIHSMKYKLPNYYNPRVLDSSFEDEDIVSSA